MPMKTPVVMAREWVTGDRYWYIMQWRSWWSEILFLEYGSEETARTIEDQNTTHNIPHNSPSRNSTQWRIKKNIEGQIDRKINDRKERHFLQHTRKSNTLQQKSSHNKQHNNKPIHQLMSLWCGSRNVIKIESYREQHQSAVRRLKDILRKERHIVDKVVQPYFQTTSMGNMGVTVHFFTGKNASQWNIFCLWWCRDMIRKNTMHRKTPS